MSDLVGNPERRFSRIAAQMFSVFYVFYWIVGPVPARHSQDETETQ